jgi:peptide/nickel transport system substrate-binding protein
VTVTRGTRVHHDYRHRRPAITVAAVTLALVAAASCGGSKSKASTPSITTASASSGSAAPATAGPTTTAALTAVSGGRIVVGVESEASSPWTPAKMQCDSSCHLRIRTILEPLMALDTKGQAQPYLAQSVTPNGDFTQWTIKLRSGISFTDGTPLNADAVIDNLNRELNSPLVSASISPIATTGAAGHKVGAFTKVDDLTVTVQMSTAWPDFPTSGLTIQPGLIASPTWLKAVDADPGKSTQPVGTGPFTMESYQPGDKMVVKRNPNYWQKDANGVQLPYLDEVEFRVIPDDAARGSALQAGDLDVIQTSSAPDIARFRTEPAQFPMLEESEETTYVLLHAGQANSPLADRRVRCGLAAASDSLTVSQGVTGNVNPVANGLFTKSQDGYLDDPGNQKWDPDTAHQLIADYTREHGQPVINLTTRVDAESRDIDELLQASWEDAGVKVNLHEEEQSALIVSAVVGAPDFNAFLWRNHAGTLDQNYFWWHSANAAPDGQFALNLGRIRDPEIDRLLDLNRASNDPVEKKKLAQQVNQEFAKQCWVIPLYSAIWGVPHKANLHGIDTATIPGTTDPLAIGAAFPGQFPLVSAWLAK